MVKVRIAVAVDMEGNWCSAGWSNADEDDLISTAIENVETGEARYWVTAELEIPKEKKPIEVKVSKVEKVE